MGMSVKSEEATKEVRAEIKKAKLQFKNMIEERLGSNNLQAAWEKNYRFAKST